MRAAGGRVHTRRGRVDKRIVKARHRKAPGGRLEGRVLWKREIS